MAGTDFPREGHILGPFQPVVKLPFGKLVKGAERVTPANRGESVFQPLP